MYESFFNLQRNPFLMTADPHFLYLSAAHREALAGLMFAILNRKGLCALIGEVEALGLDLGIAGISTVLAVAAILVSWFIYGRNPLQAAQVDPLKKSLGAVFTGAENKWFVDELYQAIILTPYTKLSYFLADVIDWRFWHDWFHETVIAGTYNWVSNIGLNEYADQRGIDAFANGLGTWTQSFSATLRKVQNGFVRSYALSVLLGVVLILGYLILK